MATKYFILVKRKGSSRWLGAIPARKGVTIAQLRKNIKSGSKSFQYKIITNSQLKRLILRLKSKGKRRSTRRSPKKRVKRRTVRRKVRRKPKRRVKRRKKR